MILYYSPLYSRANSRPNSSYRVLTDGNAIYAKPFKPFHNQPHVVISPNHSASWRHNKQFIYSVGAITGLVALIFSLMGAWLILVFTAIEITLLAYALCFVCRRQLSRQILRFKKNSLFIDKQGEQPRQEWQLLQPTLAMHIQHQRHPEGSISISLTGKNCCHNYQQVRIGEFLNHHDCLQLIAILRAQGIPLRSNSIVGQLQA